MDRRYCSYAAWVVTHAFNLQACQDVIRPTARPVSQLSRQPIIKSIYRRQRDRAHAHINLGIDSQLH
jgi:hypothetical protein